MNNAELESQLLAKLFRSATKYEQVIAAKARYPDAIAQAAKLLDKAEIARLKSMKERHNKHSTGAPDEEYLGMVRRLLWDRFPNMSREEFAREAQANMFNFHQRMNFVDAIYETALYSDTSFPRRCELMRWFNEEYQIFMENYRRYG